MTPKLSKSIPKGRKSVPKSTCKKSVPSLAASDKKKHTKKRTESYSMFIYKVLKHVYPDTGVSSKAMSVMNSFVADSFQHIATETVKLARYSNIKTLTSREIQTEIR